MSALSRLFSKLVFLRCLALLGVLVGAAGMANAAPPALVTPQLVNAVINQDFSSDIMFGGVPGLSSVTVSGLPSGLSGTDNGSGTLSIFGMPTESGIFPLSLSAANASGSVSIEMALNVKQYAANVSMVATQNSWAFHAPALAAQGGTMLTDYVTSKGYQVLTTVAGGEGFTS